jgi:hypothetical protein
MAPTGREWHPIATGANDGLTLEPTPGPEVSGTIDRSAAIR